MFTLRFSDDEHGVISDAVSAWSEIITNEIDDSSDDSDISQELGLRDALDRLHWLFAHKQVQQISLHDLRIVYNSLDYARDGVGAEKLKLTLSEFLI